jgi:drug/metabolite transporter (DMT)-like permease
LSQAAAGSKQDLLEALSLAYPMLALSYAFMPLLAAIVLGEPLSLLRGIGIGIICLGVLIVSIS